MQKPNASRDVRMNDENAVHERHNDTQCVFKEKKRKKNPRK